MNKLYLKITTVPNQLDVDLSSKEIEIFKAKYEKSRTLLTNTDVETSYINESAVNGSFAKVYSITTGLVQKDNIVVKTMYGKEKVLLTKLLSVLRDKEFEEHTLVMYNRLFLLSFLSKRFRANNIPITDLPASISTFGVRREWNLKGSHCIQSFIKGISMQTENFEETCFTEGISVDIIDHNDIVHYLKRDNETLVHNSDLNYVEALIKIDGKLNEVILPNKVTKVVDLVKKVEKKQICVTDYIANIGTLSPTVIEKIVDYTKENGLDEKQVLKLVIAALSAKTNGGHVKEAEYINLKNALIPPVDYSLIDNVVKKKNLGKKEADSLIKIYSGSDQVKYIIQLVEQYLTENNKISQVRTQNAFKYLKENLGVI